MARIQFLAEELLTSLPHEKQVLTIEEILRETEYDDESGLWLLKALKRLLSKESAMFPTPHARMRELRTCLREVYTNAVSAGRLKSGTHPKLLGFILQEILGGWEWYWETKSSGYLRIPERKENEDAEICFVFFCGAFSDWQSDKDFQETMIDLLRKYIFPSDIAGWTSPWWFPTDLDRWILHQNTPREIAETLLHGRIRHEEEGLRVAQAEMEFLGPFGLHVRSKQAVSVAQQALQKVRTIDCILQRIAEKAQPRNRRGDCNSSSPLGYVDDLEVFYDGLESGRVCITFHRPKDVNPGAIEGVRKIRDEVQSELSYPFIIKVTAEGPNGFTYNEP